jgi:hypothetical protein
VEDEDVTGQQKGEQQAGTKDSVTMEDHCTSEKQKAIMHANVVGSKEKEVVAIRCPRQTEYNQSWGMGMQWTWQHLKVLWPAIPVRVNGGHGRKVTKEKVNVCIWYLQKARNTKLPVLHVKRELLIRIFMLLQSSAGKISVCSQWSFDVFFASFLLLARKIS